VESVDLPKTMWLAAPEDKDVALVPTQPHNYAVSKRVFDVVLAGMMLILLSPLLIIVAILIRATSPGSAIYRQRRAGRYGQLFTMYKFRSMYDKQSDQLHREAFERYMRGMPLDTSTAGVEQYKLRSDPRITPLGRFLRLSSLDELPQLWNVIRGEMSLVGPRPPIPYEVERYQTHHMKRLSVTPGLTGLWQVRGRSRVTFEEMVALDLEYVVTRSFFLDVKIIVATVPAVFGHKGAG